MPTITENITTYKIGDVPLPEYTLSSLIEGQSGYLFFSSGQYLAPESPYEFSPPNKTQEIDIEYRVLTVPTYNTVESDVTDDSFQLVKDGTGFSGVILDDISSGEFAVQISTPTTNKVIALSFQAGETNYNYAHAACDYAFVFGAASDWSIWKTGALATKSNGSVLTGTYEADDTILMHYKDELLKFYLVRDGEWTLLYVTRPTWSYPITPVITLYTDDAVAELPLIYTGSVDVATLSVQSLLKFTRTSGQSVYFQGWGNNAGKRLTGEVVELAGGGSVIVGIEPKTRRRFWEISIDNDSEELRQFLDEFIDAHSLGKESDRCFWFKDMARGGNSPLEYWCYFQGDFTDPKSSGNTGNYSIGIVESAFNIT